MGRTHGIPQTQRGTLLTGDSVSWQKDISARGLKTMMGKLYIPLLFKLAFLFQSHTTAFFPIHASQAQPQFHHWGGGADSQRADPPISRWGWHLLPPLSWNLSFFLCSSAEEGRRRERELLGWLSLPRVSWPVSQRGAGSVALSSPVRKNRSLKTMLEPLMQAAQWCGTHCLMEWLLRLEPQHGSGSPSRGGNQCTTRACPRLTAYAVQASDFS